MKTKDRTGFTLIEVLAVIAIIVLVMAMSLPGLSAILRSKRWSAAVSDIQFLLMRARAQATTIRTDFSVEFAITEDNGTQMWVESEVNDIERIPDLIALQMRAGGAEAISDFIEVFYDSGGRWREDRWRYESQCRVLTCGHHWTSYDSGSAARCPRCGATGWEFGPSYFSMYYGITYNSDLAAPGVYADNARQSEIIRLQAGLEIDLAHCLNFVNWDARASVEKYGWDENRDIRLGTNGALVQTREPVLCLLREDGEERRAIKVIRCTSRAVRVPVPKTSQ